jgi:hypothetical protein
MVYVAEWVGWDKMFLVEREIGSRTKVNAGEG